MTVGDKDAPIRYCCWRKPQISRRLSTSRQTSASFRPVCFPNLLSTFTLPENLGSSSPAGGPTPRMGWFSSRPPSKDWLLSSGPLCGLDVCLMLFWSVVSHSCRKACSRVCRRTGKLYCSGRSFTTNAQDGGDASMKSNDDYNLKIKLENSGPETRQRTEL